MKESADNQLIQVCLQQIEQRYPAVEQGSWRQRDLERFQQDLMDQTGVRLSLSTLKRLWKHQFSQLPHQATLDALAQFIGFQDWHEFTRRQSVTPTDAKPRKSTRPLPLIFSVAVIALAIALILITNVGFSPSPRPIRILGEVGFDLDKTVTKGVPNTIMYHYDVSNVEADSFFIQQSWNRLLRRPIDPADNIYASIYYIPGFHRGKLVANDSIIATKRVHILTDGWMAYARYDYKDPVPVYLDHTISTGALTVDTDDLERKIEDWSKGWTISYSNIAAFDANSDSFDLSASLKLSEQDKEPCPYAEMRLITEEHIFYVPITAKGCVAGLQLKVGETVMDGQTEDLSAFGADIYEWNDLRLQVVHRKATIFLNGENIRTLSFEESFGDIKGIVFRFSGRGWVDDISLQNRRGEVVYKADFEVIEEAIASK